MSVSTTVMPTGFFLSRDDLIRFEGSGDDTKRSNMCVAPNFACGINPNLPNRLKAIAAIVCAKRAGGPSSISTSACAVTDRSSRGFYGVLPAGRLLTRAVTMSVA